MDFETMGIEAYMRLGADEYAQRRAEVIGLAKEPPEDITDEQLRSVNEELGSIEAEDARRASLADAEQRAAAAITAGAGETIVTKEEPVEAITEPKTLGEFAVRSWDGMLQKGRVDLITPEYRAASDAHVLPETASGTLAGALVDYDKNIVETRAKLNVESLFSSESISGNALTYFAENAMEGAYDVVAEGEAKPQVHFPDPTPKTVALDKIAAFIKESDEIIEDAPWLVSNINGRLLYEHDLYRQNYLVTKLLATSGIQTDTYASTAGAADIADKILQAAMDIEEDTGFAADAVIMTPALWATLRIGKNDNGDYYGGGYFSQGARPSIWDMPVVTNPNAGGIIVGAFKTCGSVVSKGGMRVEMTNADQDDFIKNMVTIRCESRLALAVRRPAGFYTITQA